MSYIKLAISAILFVLVVACGSKTVPLSSSSTNSGLATRAPDGGLQGLALVPSPTPAIVDLSPYDGNSDVDADGGSELDFEAEPDNLEGNGIGYVVMEIWDAYGGKLDSHREDNSPYCYFSDSNDECTAWVFAEQGYQWRGGGRATDGLYFARALAYDSNERKLRVEEDPFWLNLATGNESTETEINFEEIGAKFNRRDRNNDHPEYKDELEFRTGIYDYYDLPVDRVDMFIVNPAGTVVSQMSDSSAPYCGFGDAGGGRCKRWIFDQQGFKWPSGVPIQQRMYTFRAIAYRDGIPVGATSETYTILAPPSGAGQSNNPPARNTVLGCCAILADGVNDVDEVDGMLVFQTFAGENGNDGENVDRVDMTIEDARGNQVLSHTEASPRYCAFGGNETCNPSDSVGSGQYMLRASVYFRSGRTPVRLEKSVTVVR